MSKSIVLMSVLAAIFCVAVPVQAFELGARAYWWPTSLDGKIKVDGGGLEGTKVDVDDDLGIDDEDFPVFEVYFGSGKHQLSFSYYNLDFSGDNVLERTIDFNGETFNVGDQIKTTFDADVYDIRYQYDLLENEDILAGFSLGLVARVEILDGDGGVASSTTSTDEDFTIPIPFLGINVGLDILDDLLEARTLFTCGFYNGPWIDAQAEIALTPFPSLYITGGYRILYFNIDIDDLELDNFYFAGPYAGLTIKY